jgi:PAT family beta-lactamase induction signal transducer AmpG
VSEASPAAGGAARRRLPIWLMGLTMASFGAFGGVWAIATPQLLAADHVPEATIATVTTVVLLPGVLGFLLCPILDLWISRRAWSGLMAGVTGILVAAALLNHHDLTAFTVLLIAASLTATFYQGALGGWLGDLVADSERASLGAWTTVGNIGGGGLMAMAAVPILRALPAPWGAVACGSAVVVAPLALFPFIAAPAPRERLVGEGFRRLIRDLRQIIVRPAILRLVVIFAAPAAAFALTNTLSGFGAQYRASESFVSLVGGAGVMVAGIVGSLAVPPLIARIPPVRLYLSIGVVGAVFTVGLALAPKVPAVLAAGLLGENIFQAAAFAASNAITYWSLGKDNPLAASQVSLLVAASVAPITYMQYVDGHAYAFHGVVGSYLADALISAAACALLFLVFRRFSAQPAPAAASTAA